MRAYMLAFALLVGCGGRSTSSSDPSGASASRRPSGDQSQPFPEWETTRFSLSAPPGSSEGEVRGKVTEIRPPAGETPGALRIEPAGGAAIELPLLGSGGIALAVDDEVVAKWSVSQDGLHTVESISVVDREGRVVYVESGFGDIGLAPGWRFEVKHVFERAKPHSRGFARAENHWVVLAKGDAVAYLHAHEPARRLSTPDGDFVVYGIAITWSGKKLPSEASEYESFSIVRLK